METILFLQLAGTPVCMSDYCHNVPFAAGCLKAFLKKKGMDERFRMLIPDHRDWNLFGDEKIIDHIVKINPEWISFTLYLWNSERSLYIASNVKSKLPSCRIVAGGPEVTEDNDWLLKCPDVDFFVSGEGEEALFALLSSKAKGKFIKAKELLESLSSPYLSGDLTIEPDEPVFIETQRGCPYSCDFCFYPKGSGKLRYLNVAEVDEILKLARKGGAREIVFVDPTFNNHRSFEELLDLLIDANKDSFFSYNAEIKPQLLSENEISKVNRAGFVTLEVGLQTIHESTQRSIHCIVPLQKFTKKVNRLSQNIAIRLDLISGLPDEDLEDLKKSIEYVIAHHPGADIYLYHLSCLPGTKLRMRMKGNFQKMPPYFILNNGKLDEEGMKKVGDIYLKLTGKRLDPSPDLDDIYQSRVNSNYHLITKGFSAGDEILRSLNAFNIFEFRSDELSPEFCEKMLGIIKASTFSNPFCTFVVFVNIPGVDASELTPRILKNLGLAFDQYITRSRIFGNSEPVNFRLAYL